MHEFKFEVRNPDQIQKVKSKLGSRILRIRFRLTQTFPYPRRYPRQNCLSTYVQSVRSLKSELRKLAACPMHPWCVDPAKLRAPVSYSGILTPEKTAGHWVRPSRPRCGSKRDHRSHGIADTDRCHKRAFYHDFALVVVQHHWQCFRLPRHTAHDPLRGARGRPLGTVTTKKGEACGCCVGIGAL